MKKFIIFLIVLVLSGCATTYQRGGFTGGYSEIQLGENIFQVSFRGNAFTSRERASDFSLLRSAELALEKGFRYFVILDSEKYSKIGTYTTPTQSYTTATAFGSIGSATTTSRGGETFFTSKPTTTNTLLCFTEKPETTGFFFDAEFVVKSIKQKYKIN